MIHDMVFIDGLLRAPRMLFMLPIGRSISLALEHGCLKAKITRHGFIVHSRSRGCMVSVSQ